MTRLFLFFVCALCTFQSFAAEFNSTVLKKSEDGIWQYEKVIVSDNQSKEVLYKTIKDWVLQNVRTVDNNIIFDDINFEAIVTTPTIQLADIKRLCVNQTVNFKLVIKFKDNRIRVSATGFNYHGVDGGRAYMVPIQELHIKNMFPNPEKKVFENFDLAFSSFITLLEKATMNTKKDTW